MRGITPVVSVVILLIIAVAVVGLAYGFITGFFNTVTGKAAIVSGASSCVGGNAGSITIRNAGTGNINITTDASGALTGDVTILRTSGGLTPTWSSNAKGCTGGSNCLVAPGESGTITEVSNKCGSGNTCKYDVSVGGVVFPTRVDC